MKKILFILVLIITVFMLVGCAEVTYSVTITDVGGRIYDYKVTLDPNAPETSKDIQLVRTYFEFQKSQNEYAEVIYDEETPNVIIYRVTYESQTEYNKVNGITGDEPNEPSEFTEKGLFKIYEGVLFDMDKVDFALYALSYLSRTQEDGGVSFNYELREHLKTYINDSNLSAVANECIIRICTDTDKSTSEALRLELMISEVADELADVTYNIFKDMGYDYAKVIATFEYSHAYKSIKGINPDKVETVKSDLGTKKVYSWNLDVLGDNEITYTYQTANVWVWELIAVAFGVAVALITLVIFFVRRKKFLRHIGEINSQNRSVQSANSRNAKGLTSNSNNNPQNVKNNPPSQYASWFGYSENHINNNANKEVNANSDNDKDDVFEGYFDDKLSNNKESTDNKDE